MDEKEVDSSARAQDRLPMIICPGPFALRRSALVIVRENGRSGSLDKDKLAQTATSPPHIPSIEEPNRLRPEARCAHHIGAFLNL
jgi:hypothetical protein